MVKAIFCQSVLWRRFSTKLVQTPFTGLYYDREARTKLLQIYRATREVLTKMPSEYYYRQTVDSTLAERIIALEKGQVNEIAFGEGLLEEVVEQAEEEHRLAIQMLEWKPWDS